MSIKAEQLEWRRSKVTELRAIGLSYAEIAQQLQVPKTSVAEDMQYLRKRAKESIKEYTTEYLPEQYQDCLHALDTVLKNAFVIMTKSEDNREKLQAMQLFKDTHLVKLELLSNATTIDSALNFIRSKQQTQQSQQQSKKRLAPDSTDDDHGDGDIDCGDSNDSELTKEAGRQTIF